MKNCKPIFNSLLLLVICVFLMECNHVVDNWKGGAIDKTGEYRLPNNRFVISVKNNNNLLEYSVTDQQGKEIIRTDENSSILQKWFLFWDPNENLWVFSSDIGNWIWRKNGPGSYIKIYLNKESSLKNEMPSELKKMLSRNKNE